MQIKLVPLVKNFWLLCNIIIKFVNILQIEMGFLMVGHTHEDIDQSFSCLSRLLRKVDSLTITGTTVLLLCLTILFS